MRWVLVVLVVTILAACGESGDDPTPTPVPPMSEDAYDTWYLSNRVQRIRTDDALSAIVGDGVITDEMVRGESWRAAVEMVIDQVHAAFEDARSVTPPTRMKNEHAALLTSIECTSAAADALDAAMEEDTFAAQGFDDFYATEGDCRFDAYSADLRLSAKLTAGPGVLPDDEYGKKMRSERVRADAAWQSLRRYLDDSGTSSDDARWRGEVFDDVQSVIQSYAAASALVAPGDVLADHLASLATMECRALASAEVPKQILSGEIRFWWITNAATFGTDCE